MATAAAQTIDDFDRVITEILGEGTNAAPSKKTKAKKQKKTASGKLTVYKSVDAAISGDKDQSTTMSSIDEALSKFVDKQTDDVVRYELIATKPSAGVVLLRTLSPPNSKTLKHLSKLTGATAELKINKERKNDEDFIAIVKRQQQKLKPKKKIEKGVEKKPKSTARDTLSANMQKLKKKTVAAATGPTAVVAN